MQRKRKRRVKCFAPQNACRCGPLLGSNGDFTAAGIASCPRKRRRTLAQARSSPLPCHSKTRIRPNENMTIPRNSSFLVVSCVLGEGGIWGSHTPLGAIRAIGWYYQNQALLQYRGGKQKCIPKGKFEWTHGIPLEPIAQSQSFLVSGLVFKHGSHGARIAKTKQYLSRIARVEGDRRQGARAASGDNRGASRRGGGKPPIETDLTGSRVHFILNRLPACGAASRRRASGLPAWRGMWMYVCRNVEIVFGNCLFLFLRYAGTGAGMLRRRAGAMGWRHDVAGHGGVVGRSW